MPIHLTAWELGDVRPSKLVLAAIALIVLVALKAHFGGRRSTWERDWAGKMILVVVSRGTWSTNSNSLIGAAHTIHP